MNRTTEIRGRKMLGLLMVAVLTVAGVMVGASPAAGAKIQFSISASINSSTVGLGRVAIVSGRVTADGRNVPHAKVTVVGKSVADGSWKTLGTTRTKSNGKYKFSFKPGEGYSLRAKVASSSRGTARTSRTRQFVVRPVLSSISPGAVSVAVPSRSKLISGKVSSVLKGNRVVLLSQTGLNWKSIAETRFDSSGRFEFTVSSKKEITERYKVFVPSTAKLASVTSFVREVKFVKNSAVLRDTEDCFGAASDPIHLCRNPRLDGLLLPSTDSVALLADTGGAFKCWKTAYELVSSCAYGSTKPGAVRVALVGDSHAAGYVPALRDQVGRHNWRLDTFLGVKCRWMELPTTDPCYPRAVDIQERLLAGNYDLIVYTGQREIASSREPEVQKAEAQAVADRYSGVWNEIIASGTPVVAIGDYGTAHDLACVIGAKNSAAAKCSEKQSSMYRTIDPLPIAVAQTEGSRLVTIDEMFCSDGLCPLTRGNVIVYRDAHHLTGMYSETIGPFLMTKLLKELDE